MRCQWPVLSTHAKWAIRNPQLANWHYGGRFWRKCWHDASHTVAGLEVCLQHAYIYRRRFHAHWMAQGMRGDYHKPSYYYRGSAEIMNIETGRVDRGVKEADEFQDHLRYDLMMRDYQTEQQPPKEAFIAAGLHCHVPEDHFAGEETK